ncbi:Type 1 glutamine amidotransferase-like domain-containing protein [Candidatus Woesearchaeota archaeon]|nr:Type 1 glutamine amidotransferase-like domain-containing protein [Candidatus Woesearchaeota archaeon]
MRFYLSSYKLGSKTEKLKELMPKGNAIGLIPNALDYTKADPVRREEGIKEDIGSLMSLGFVVETVDLKDYFGKTDQLRKKLDLLGGVFIRGGNAFVLRQAMRLSGFDVIFKELLLKDDFLYAGFSAGICVLAADLTPLKIVDDATDTPYRGQDKVIWEGLGYLDYIILPHYDSEHPESADIDKTVKFCIRNSIPFRTLRDGDVIVI